VAKRVGYYIVITFVVGFRPFEGAGQRLGNIGGNTWFFGNY
jgi:hypothetical protein